MLSHLAFEGSPLHVKRPPTLLVWCHLDSKIALFIDSVCERAFRLFLRLGVLGGGSKFGKGKTTPLGFCDILRLSVAGARGFLVLAHACAALRFGLLLPALSRLTHIL